MEGTGSGVAAGVNEPEPAGDSTSAGEVCSGGAGEAADAAAGAALPAARAAIPSAKASPSTTATSAGVRRDGLRPHIPGWTSGRLTPLGSPSTLRSS